VILIIFLRNEEEKCMENLSVIMMSGKDDCKFMSEAATTCRSDIFCIYLVREIDFLSGKTQEILMSSIYGNHVHVLASL